MVAAVVVVAAAGGETAYAKVMRQERTQTIWGTGRGLDLNHCRLSDAQRLNEAERVHRRLESKVKAVSGKVLMSSNVTSSDLCFEKSALSAVWRMD